VRTTTPWSSFVLVCTSITRPTQRWLTGHTSKQSRSETAIGLDGPLQIKDPLRTWPLRSGVTEQRRANSQPSGFPAATAFQASPPAQCPSRKLRQSQACRRAAQSAEQRRRSSRSSPIGAIVTIPPAASGIEGPEFRPEPLEFGASKTGSCRGQAATSPAETAWGLRPLSLANALQAARQGGACRRNGSCRMNGSTALGLVGPEGDR